MAPGAAIVLDDVEALLGIATVVGGHGAAAGEQLQALAIVGADLEVLIGAGEVTFVGHALGQLVQPDRLSMLVDCRQMAALDGQHTGARSGEGQADDCRKRKDALTV